MDVGRSDAKTYAPGLEGVIAAETAISIARMAGWAAQCIEQASANRLIRPDARYVGPAELELPA